MRQLSGFLSLAFLICILATPAAALPDGGVAVNADYDGYIVKLNDTASMRARTMARGAAAGGDYLVVDSLDEAEEIPSEYVDYIEPNYIVTLFGPPNDPLYGGYQWNLQNIGMERVYALGLDGQGAKIAFIDSGIYRAHEDLNGALITGKNFTGDGRLYTDDLTGHGTFAAGLVAAQTGNGTGLAGIAPGAGIMAYRAFSGGSTTTMAAVVDAINAAVTDGCDILNLSLGTSSTSQLLKEAIDRAEAAGVVMVAAVGNDGTAVLKYPAAYSAVIGVGSVNAASSRSSTSNANSSVYITAPGEGVYSLGYLAADQYGSGSGTSYAAPVVAGLAALALGYDGDITPDGIRYLLRTTATDRGAIGYDNYYGYGVVNAAAFAEELTRSFEIHYMANGGELPEGVQDTYQVTDDAYKLPTPTREGYAFAGWYEASDLSGAKATQIRAGSLGDRTLFAAWASESSVAIASVAVAGYPAVWQEADGGYYLAALPYGTNLSGLTIGNISVVPALESSVATVTKAAGDDSGAAWVITVSAGAPSREYSLRVETVQLHVGAGNETQAGEASPASLDGLADAISYVADGSLWFAWADGRDALPEDFACEVELTAGGGEAAVDIDGVTVRYTPSPGDAGGNAVIAVYGVSDGRRTLDAAVLTVCVDALPFSQPVAADTAACDLYLPAGAELVLTLYENQISAVSIDGGTVPASRYTLSEITTDGKTILTLSPAAVAGLPTGSHTVQISFGAGLPCTVALAVTDSAPRYTVTFVDRGQTAHTASNVRTGSTVSLPAAPVQNGYTFDGWYTAANARFTALTPVTQTMTITARWTANSAGPPTGPPTIGSGGGGGGGGSPAPPKAPTWENPFSDVGQTDWFYEDVRYAVENGLFKGTGDGVFSPAMPLSRAMAVTVLYRCHLQGAPEAAATQSGFSDVSNGAYYSAAVQWAAAADIVHGNDSGLFGPDGAITRQDFAVILVRYIQLIAPDCVITPDYVTFTDEDEIAPYAKDAMQTLFQLGIIGGIGEGRVAPRDSVTRVQAAAMLRRLLEGLPRSK